MTIQQIWEEYRQEQPDGYSYSQFCYHFQVWRDGDEVTMHIEHKVGDKLFVDFAGKKLTVSERHGGGGREMESFVAMLGASQLGYLEAVEAQQKANLIAGSGGALDYVGGVPAAIVPDCLKSAVTKADPYEPDLNRAYAAFARHYGIRHRQPRSTSHCGSPGALGWTASTRMLAAILHLTARAVDDAVRTLESEGVASASPMPQADDATVRLYRPATRDSE